MVKLSDSGSKILLDCPFCGNDPTGGDDCLLDVVYPVDSSYTLWQVVCNYNGGGGCGATMFANSKEKAIHKWNTRSK